MTWLRRGARIGAPLAASGVVVSGLLPWTISGSAERNSFATVQSARILEVAGTGWGQWLLALWFFVPALAGATWLLVLLHRPRPAGVAAVVVGIVAVGLAASILAAPIARGAGVVPGLVCGLVALMAGAVLVGAPD